MHGWVMLQSTFSPPLRYQQVGFVGVESSGRHAAGTSPMFFHVGYPSLASKPMHFVFSDQISAAQVGEVESHDIAVLEISPCLHLISDSSPLSLIRCCTA
jgi:hypothetical protein